MLELKMANQTLNMCIKSVFGQQLLCGIINGHLFRVPQFGCLVWFACTQIFFEGIDLKLISAIWANIVWRRVKVDIFVSKIVLKGKLYSCYD